MFKSLRVRIFRNRRFCINRYQSQTSTTPAQDKTRKWVKIASSTFKSCKFLKIIIYQYVYLVKFLMRIYRGLFSLAIEQFPGWRGCRRILRERSMKVENSMILLHSFLLASIISSCYMQKWYFGSFRDIFQFLTSLLVFMESFLP